MKKLIIVIALIIGGITNGFSQFKVPNPQPELFINDYVGVLNADQKVSLLTKIRAFEKSSSIQICIILYDDFQGYEVEDVTLKIGREWGVGQRGLNNGVIYLVSPGNRKGRIEVGPGLQGELTDMESVDIQEKVKSYYRNGDYYTGINQVLDDIISTLKPISMEERQQLKVQKEKESAELRGLIFEWFLGILGAGLIIGLIIFLFYKAAQARKDKEERIANLQYKYKGLINQLGKLYSNFIKYKDLISEVSLVVDVIKTQLDKSIPNNEKELQNSLDFFNSIINSEDVKNATILIQKEEQFLNAKNELKSALEIYSPKKVNAKNVNFRLVESNYEKIADDYFTLFSKQVDKKYLYNLFNKELASIQESYSILEKFSVDDQLIRKNIFKVKEEISELKHSFEVLNSIIAQYEGFKSSVEVELNEIEQKRKNILNTFKNKINNYSSQVFVDKSTEKTLLSHFAEAEAKYKQWQGYSSVNQRSSLKTDLNFISTIEAIIGKAEITYAKVYQPWKQEEDRKRAEAERLAAIKRRKEEEEEEERRRKRRREEEEENRRRDSYNSYNSYSSSSWSSSSNSDSSSFGGGSFDGGGGSSSW